MVNNIINKLKNLYYSIRYSNFVGRILYSRPLRIRILSSIVFVVLFFLIFFVFEFLFPNENDLNNLIHNILFFGL
jgi:uncharacterized membrane protein